MTGSKPITLKVIAEMAGVDKALVSKVVNHIADGEVSEAKRKKIEEIVARFGYTPLNAAKSLATRRTRQLMFLFSDKTFCGLSNDYYAQMLQGVVDVCRPLSYNCVLNIHDFTDIRDFILPENLRNYSVDGCILAGIFDDSLITKLNSVQLPVLVVDRPCSGTDIPVVNHYDFRDHSPLFEYLRRTNHRRIWIASPHLFRGHGVPPEKIRIEKFDHSGEDVSRFAEELIARFASLRKPERPTVFIGDGHTCLYFLRNLKEHGFRCPEDVSIISASDFEAHAWCEPPMTLAVQNAYDIGCFAARLILDVLTGKVKYEKAPGLAREKTFPLQIVERDSVRRL